MHSICSYFEKLHISFKQHGQLTAHANCSETACDLHKIYHLKINKMQQRQYQSVNQPGQLTTGYSSLHPTGILKRTFSAIIHPVQTAKRFNFRLKAFISKKR
jgi:hypothetical protein